MRKVIDSKVSAGLSKYPENRVSFQVFVCAALLFLKCSVTIQSYIVVMLFSAAIIDGHYF